MKHIIQILISVLLSFSMITNITVFAEKEDDNSMIRKFVENMNWGPYEIINEVDIYDILGIAYK